MKYPLLIFLTVALLSGCNELKEGTVIAKEVEPAHSYVYMMPMAHHIGKVTTYTYIPIPMYDDEDYKISVLGYDKQGREMTETFYVSKYQYQCLSTGSHFIVDSNCSKKPNNDKETE